MKCIFVKKNLDKIQSILFTCHFIALSVKGYRINPASLLVTNASLQWSSPLTP